MWSKFWEGVAAVFFATMMLALVAGVIVVVYKKNPQVVAPVPVDDEPDAVGIPAIAENCPWDTDCDAVWSRYLVTTHPMAQEYFCKTHGDLGEGAGVYVYDLPPPPESMEEYFARVKKNGKGN